MQPMLSFAVVDAGKCKIKASLDDGEDGEELNSGKYIVERAKTYNDLARPWIEKGNLTGITFFHM